MGHTHGPWAIDDRLGSDWVFIEPDVCQIPRGAVHNAALLAAAPEMLAALEEVSTWLISPDTSPDAIDEMRGICRAAIASAKGGQ